MGKCNDCMNYEPKGRLSDEKSRVEELNKARKYYDQVLENCNVEMYEFKHMKDLYEKAFSAGVAFAMKEVSER